MCIERDVCEWQQYHHTEGTDSISIAMCYATKKPISDSNSDALVSIGGLMAGIANSDSNNMAGNYSAWNYLW